MANSKFLQNAKRKMMKLATNTPLRPVVTFGALGLSRYMDFTEPNMLIGLRIMNVAVVSTVCIILLACFFLIKRNPDGERKIQVLQSDLVAPEFSDDPDAEDPKLYVSVKDYDLRQLRVKVQAVGTQAMITGGLHMYAGLTLPMLIQCFTIPMEFSKNELFQLYVLGKDPKIHSKLKRPWKTDKGKFMNLIQRSIRDAGKLADGGSFSDLGNKPKVNAKKQAKRDKAKRK